MSLKLVTSIALVVGCGGKLDAPLPHDAGADATEAADVIDGGTTCVPFDGASPPVYTSGTGCFSSAMTMNSQPVCPTDEFSVSCVGALPQTPIPLPPDAGDCAIIGMPTPENVLFWCCRCAF